MVGETGRVIAFEPIPEIFELLAANTVNTSFLLDCVCDQTSILFLYPLAEM